MFSIGPIALNIFFLLSPFSLCNGQSTSFVVFLNVLQRFFAHE